MTTDTHEKKKEKKEAQHKGFKVNDLISNRALHTLKQWIHVCVHLFLSRKQRIPCPFDFLSLSYTSSLSPSQREFPGNAYGCDLVCEHSKTCACFILSFIRSSTLFAISPQKINKWIMEDKWRGRESAVQEEEGCWQDNRRRERKYKFVKVNYVQPASCVRIPQFVNFCIRI